MTGVALENASRGCTYIDHDRLLAERVQRASSVDSTPIELNRASDAVNAAAKYDCAMVVECDVVRRCIISGVL